MAPKIWINIFSGNGLETALSHHQNQCWLISKVLWHSHKINFTRNAQDICPWYEFENYWFNITAIYVRVHSVSTHLWLGQADDNMSPHRQFATWHPRWALSRCQHGSVTAGMNCTIYSDLEQTKNMHETLMKSISYVIARIRSCKYFPI